MRRVGDAAPPPTLHAWRLRTVLALLIVCGGVSANTGPSRRLQQTTAEKTFAHPVGDAFADLCLEYLAGDMHGRLLPAVCPNYTMAPQSALPGQRGCLAQSVAQPQLDDKGRQVVVVLEDNGWRSQSMVNALATMLLQEELGYRVVLHHDTHTQTAAQRVSQSTSHAVLEYWAYGKEAAHSDAVAAKRITLRALGYLGEAGLYAMDTCRRANSSIWWDWYMTYVTDVATTRHYLSHNHQPRSVPPRAYRVNSTAELAWVSTTHVVHAVECTSPLCQYGQFYPRVCEPDHDTRVTHCPEVFLLLPEYNEGYFEGLLAGHNAQLTGVYLGDTTEEVLADFQANQKPAVFYAFHPSEVYSQFPASRVVFPQRAHGMEEATEQQRQQPADGLRYHDYPRQPLQKVLNLAAFDDQYLHSAMLLLQALTVSQDLMQALMARSSAGATPHETVCTLIAQDEVLERMLRDLVPQDLDHSMRATTTTVWQLVQLSMLLLGPLLFMFSSIIISYSKEEETNTSISAHAIKRSTQLLKVLFAGPTIAAGMITCFTLALHSLTTTPLEASVHTALYAVLYTLCTMASGYLLWWLLQLLLSLVQSRMDTLAKLGTTEAGQGELSYVSRALVPFAKTACTAIIVMAMIVLLMQRFGDNSTALLVTSAFGFTIALSMSELLKDWFAGATVLSDNQYNVGDWVVIHGSTAVEGVVEEVSLRCTKVRGLNEHLYFVKNREISTAVVENVTSRWTSRIDVNFFLSATSDPGKVQHFLNVVRKQIGALSGFASFYQCHIAKVNEQGFHIKMGIASYHAPGNERYKKFKNWGYGWVWADPYFNLITEIQILISHLLKTFGLHLGGELRVNPSRPLSLHNAAVGAEVVKAAEEAEVSTLILDTLVDANLERPLESNSTALDVLSTSTVITNEFTMFVTTFNMSKQPLVTAQLHHWLPMPGTVDMLVVGVQNCDYKLPPRSEEWMAEARRALLSSSRLGGGRVHFDFLATLVNYLGPSYKFIGDVSRDKTRLAVFMLKSKAINVSSVRVDTSVYQSHSNATSANAAALSLMYFSTPLLFVNVCMPRFDSLFKGGTVPGREAMAMRNRILTNLLQQLPAVRQIANADLLVQFRGVVVLGAMNYGSRGNHEAVASAVTKVFRDRIKQERRIRRLKEMDKRYHLLDPTIVPRHSSGGGIHRAPSWSTIEEVLPETEIPDYEWIDEPSEAVGLAALDLASPAGLKPSTFNELEDSPLRTHSNPLDNLARSARLLALAPSKTDGGDGDQMIDRRASLPCLGLHRPPQHSTSSHMTHSPSLVSCDSVRHSSDTDSIKLDTDELTMFQTVYQEVDTLWRELKNGRVLSGFQDAEPFYLPTFGYDELLPLLWERTPAQGTKSPCGVTQKTFTAPKSAPSPDKKSLRRTGSFSSIATNMEEYCQKPMWADRVLWRGADTGTLEQVSADAHMRVKSSAHKPVSSSFIVRGCKLPSLFQQQDVGLSSVNTLSSSMEVCSMVVTGLTVRGLSFKRFAASSSSFYMLFQGEALLSEETVTDGPTMQTPGMAAAAASLRTSKAKERGGVVSFPDDSVPVLRSPCRHRSQLQHLVLVFSLVECAPWHASEIVAGSASLHLKHAIEAGPEAAHSFSAELTSGGRIVGQVNGDITVDDGETGVITTEDDIVLQTLELQGVGDA